MLKIRIDFPGHNSISCDKRKRKFILEIEENKREKQAQNRTSIENKNDEEYRKKRDSQIKKLIHSFG